MNRSLIGIGARVIGVPRVSGDEPRIKEAGGEVRRVPRVSGDEPR